MGSRGDCFDNAVAESFFATLKKQLVRRRSWPNRRELQSAVFDYIETFYNRERKHSTLGYLSPREFEMISLLNKQKNRKSSPDLSSEAGEDQFQHWPLSPDPARLWHRARGRQPPVGVGRCAPLTAASRGARLAGRSGELLSWHVHMFDPTTNAR
jgi:hypothetical protein